MGTLDTSTQAGRGHAVACWQALTPVGFLLRSAATWPARTAVSAGDEVWTYGELLQRVERLAGMLRAHGVAVGERVATMLPNVPEALELHFAVPGIGAVLVPINPRLGAREVRYVLRHGDVRCLIAHASVQPVVDGALWGLEPEKRPVVLLVGAPGTEGSSLSRALDAAQLLSLAPPEDENALISINYTSGTTGDPKGVMCTHRGAYLSALAHAYGAEVEPDSTYLWTLPMSHCNGWTHPWAVTAAGARHVCLELFNPARIWELIEPERVTHLAGAPTLFTLLAESPRARRLDGVRAMVAGAAPSRALLGRLAQLGFDVIHGYGLTETYGPLCTSRGRVRQGTAMLAGDVVRVVDDQLRDVPADGETIGEIVMRGNNVTPGYYRDEAATAHAWRGGWFHSGDLAVKHPDGDVEIRDRAKDIVIFGGENISTIEVEQVLLDHPGVVQAAVVGVPDERWGEALCAFVVARDPSDALAGELRAWVGSRLAQFKVPRYVVCRERLPTTATGKIEKRALRDGWCETAGVSGGG